MKNLIYFIFLLLVGCFNSSPNQKNQKNLPINLADKVFSFGPLLDSMNAQVIAECDCCASDILFNNDSSFIAAFYCLEGDSYAKGKFSTTNSMLTLKFDPIEVTKLYDLEVEEDTLINQGTSKYQVTNRQIPNSKMNISFLKSKIVLTVGDIENDYGIANKNLTKLGFLDNLRKDGVLHYLQTD